MAKDQVLLSHQGGRLFHTKRRAMQGIAFTDSCGRPLFCISYGVVLGLLLQSGVANCVSGPLNFLLKFAMMRTRLWLVSLSISHLISLFTFERSLDPSR